MPEPAAPPALARAAAPRATIEVRRPAIDLSSSAADPESPASIPRFWWGGDPFRTHFADALSSTFPFGEAFFVRSVRHYSERIDDPTLRAEIRAFAGQEGQHSRIHDDHVDLLLAQGYGALETRNRIIDRVMRWHNKRFPKLSLAVTAALEHLTAILARQVLLDPGGWVEDMHPEMKKLWRWHALEEAEHKSVAFDVLVRVAPSRAMRVYVMALNTFGLSIEVLERMIYMLWKDGRLFDLEVWRGGMRFLFGQNGFFRGVGPSYRAWYRRDFHPNEIDDRDLIAAHASNVEASIVA